MLWNLSIPLYSIPFLFNLIILILIYFSIRFPYFQESHYCSRCGKLRTPEQFDTFKTCEICRKTSESHQNLEKSTINILNEWVQKAGEQEIRLQKL
jgi:hypothetical protein